MRARVSSRVQRLRRHARIRGRVSGVATRPRLGVFRSLKHISAQIIDDGRGHTLVAASSQEAQIREQVRGKKKAEVASLVGAVLAQKALAQGIEQVVFDRGGYRYHGRVKALAEAARQAGLKF